MYMRDRSGTRPHRLRATLWLLAAVSGCTATPDTSPRAPDTDEDFATPGNVDSLADPRTDGIRGTVRGPEGARVPGAVVTIVYPASTAFRGPSRRTVGADGGFEFARLPVANYRLRISDPERRFATGYATAEIGTASLNIVLSPRRSLTGRLVNEDGEFLPDATVYLDVPGRDRSSATTDESGRFSLDDLDSHPGVLVAVARTSSAGIVRQRVLRVPDTGYTLERREFRLSRGLAIGGTIRDPRGRVVSGAGVQAIPSGGEFAAKWEGLDFDAATTDQFGRFVIGGLAPRRYRLKSWTPHALSTTHGPARVLCGGDDVEAGDSAIGLTLDTRYPE